MIIKSVRDATLIPYAVVADKNNMAKNLSQKRECK
jgi:hypothetical protein